MDKDAIFKQLNRSKYVQGHITEVARRYAARAAAISKSAGGTARYKVDTHVRPKGRFVANVISDNPAEEYGTDDTPRIGALRRAVRGG